MQTKLNNRYSYNPKTAQLGQGGFSVTFIAYDEQEKKNVTLKFFKHSISHKQKFKVITEFEKISKLKHPNIQELYELLFIETETEIKVVLVAEYAEQTLKGFWLSKNEISEYMLYSVLVQILYAISFIHKAKEIHRDIKASNILVNNTPNGIQIKVSDVFELWKCILSQEEIDLVATPSNIALEQFTKNGQVSNKLDIWQFGLLLYWLITEKHLLENQNLPHGYTWKFSEWTQIIAESVSYATFITEITKINFSTNTLRRLERKVLFASSDNTDLIVNHFFKDLCNKVDIGQKISKIPPTFRDILSLCLQKNPNERCGDVYKLIEMLPD